MRLRFSIRDLLGLTALVAMGLAWESRKGTFYFFKQTRISPFLCPLYPCPAPSPSAGRAGKGLLQCPLNFVHHTPDVFIERLIATPNDSESARRGIAATNAMKTGDRRDRKGAENL
jgi:hypothetical protein